MLTAATTITKMKNSPHKMSFDEVAAALTKMKQCPDRVSRDEIATLLANIEKTTDKMSHDERVALFRASVKMSDEAWWKNAVILHAMVKDSSAAETGATLAEHGNVFTVSEVEEMAEIGGQDLSDKNRERLRRIMLPRSLGHRN
jgi:hypothetical protein